MNKLNYGIMSRTLSNRFEAIPDSNIVTEFSYFCFLCIAENANREECFDYVHSLESDILKRTSIEMRNEQHEKPDG